MALLGADGAMVAPREHTDDVVRDLKASIEAYVTMYREAAISSGLPIEGLMLVHNYVSPTEVSILVVPRPDSLVERGLVNQMEQLKQENAQLLERLRVLGGPEGG